MIDLLLPAAPKDYVKVRHVIISATECVDEIGRVCLVTPDGFDPGVIPGVRVDCYTDTDVLPSWYDRSSIGWRPSWITQQIIKLVQNVTDTDYWLTTDADTFFVRKLAMFAEGKPILYTGQDQYYSPYFSFNQALLGCGKLHDRSFLSEATLYNRKIVDELLDFCGGRDEFIRKTIEIINSGKGHPADSEIYAAYVLTHYPDMYDIRQLVTVIKGRYGENVYTEAEIAEWMTEMAGEACDTFSLHSWS